MDHFLERANKVLAKINALASISDIETGIARTFGTKAFLEGRALVEKWMREAGLKTSIDNIGNVRGRLECDDKNAKTFVIASHIDTVINAGRFDGPLGVLMGLDLLENLQKTSVKRLFHIELIAFSDEEGVRFHTTYLGSKVVAGSFDFSLMTKEDANGVTLQEVVNKMGGVPQRLSNDALGKDNWLGYFEIHIEQGPVLYENHVPVAIVTAIAGQRRVEIAFKGVAGHAGTVPMHMRQDALCCAAECVLEIEKYALANKENIVATVGKLTIPNAASNVIAGDVICSLDLRSADENVLNESYIALQNIVENVGKSRNIDVKWTLIQGSKPVLCDANLQNLLSKSIEKSGYEVIKLVSGAGHDAVPISEVSPVSMLFVRCYKGISHNPLENMEIDDIAAAIKVSDGFLELLVNQKR
jgi:allantoate deiminase